ESSDSKDSLMYPSIRKLPLLGVKYADLYRRTKIQETVFELLTQQYELAKVQEAKEIPSVKVLDPALRPTKRSFPPIGTIIVVGTAFGLFAAMAWVFADYHWESIETNDPRKMFALEVFSTLKRDAARVFRKR